MREVSYILKDIFDSKTGLFEDRFEGSQLEYLAGMHWNGNPAVFSSMFEDKMATSLVMFIKTKLLQGAYKFLGGKPRKLGGHAGILTFSDISSGIGRPSFCRDSTYAWIASFIFWRASSYVSPSEMHPGSAGAVTVYPPSSAGVKVTVY